MIFKPEPGRDDVFRVLEMVVHRRALRASSNAYRAAILAALDARICLTDLSDNARPDNVTRHFPADLLSQMDGGAART